MGGKAQENSIAAQLSTADPGIVLTRPARRRLPPSTGVGPVREVGEDVKVQHAPLGGELLVAY